MSVRQDRFTFFGVLIAVVIVVLGYLQLGQLYPVAGRDAPQTQNEEDHADSEAETEGGSLDHPAREEDAAD